MEFFTVFLTSLLSLISPTGLVVDRVATKAIRSQFTQVKQLEVRVDNVPSYQLLQGKLGRVRIAGRGLRLKRQNIRFAVLEVETDGIDFDVGSLRRGLKLRKPVDAGVHLVLHEQDVNQALATPELVAKLRQVKIGLDNGTQKYYFVNPQIAFLNTNRLRLQVELGQDSNIRPLLIVLESGIGVNGEQKLQLIEPVIWVNGQAVPPQFVKAIAHNLNQKLNFDNLASSGLLARILKLNIRQHELEVAVFFRVEPTIKFWETHRP
jgi:LmeA-like phospholipid-binding